MGLTNSPEIEISEDLLEAIRSFPTKRVVEHCGVPMAVSPFDLYADCRGCGVRIKLRAFSAGFKIEDIFDAVFAWRISPEARDIAVRREETLREEEEPVAGQPNSQATGTVPASVVLPRAGRCIELD